jgi:hypothetical protein
MELRMPNREIQIEEDVADALAKEAERRGLSLADFLALVAGSELRGTASSLSAEELDRLIDDEASDDVTVGGTQSRADIYDDHG